jgi:DNA-binding transcriptional ArsR family regulator
MKPVKTLTDPEAFKLLADETRRKIVFLLRVKEMTACQIAEELDVTPQAIYHHIKKLVDGGLIEVTREERVAHLIESYYRATAEVFNLVVGTASRDKQSLKEQIAGALAGLKRLGFSVEADDKAIEKLAELQVELNECCDLEKLDDLVSKLEDVDFVTRLTVEEYIKVLSMSDEQRAKHEKNERKFYELLKSLVKKRANVSSKEAAVVNHNLDKLR